MLTFLRVKNILSFFHEWGDIWICKQCQSLPSGCFPELWFMRAGYCIFYHRPRKVIRQRGFPCRGLLPSLSSDILVGFFPSTPGRRCAVSSPICLCYSSVIDTWAQMSRATLQALRSTCIPSDPATKQPCWSPPWAWGGGGGSPSACCRRWELGGVGGEVKPISKPIATSDRWGWIFRTSGVPKFIHRVKGS